MKSIADKLAVVTGGSQGIGRQTAIELSRHRCRIVLLARNPLALEDTAEVIRENGGVAYPMVCNASDHTQVETTFQAIKEQYGDVDILINCAGVGSFGRYEDYTTQECIEPLLVPGIAAINTSRAVVSAMKRKGSGAIVNILTPASYFPLPYMAPYTASRWALNGFSQSLHHELKSHGIHIGCVCPGRVTTDYLSHNNTSMDWWPRISSVFPDTTPEYVAKQVLKNIQHEKKETIFPFLLWVFVRCYQLFPDTVIRLLEWLRLFQPTKVLSEPREVSINNATNWEESISLDPARVVYPTSVADVMTIIKDADTYPSPVRTAGPRHSTTHCAVADKGTLMIMRRMNRIISIDPVKMTVTTEPGALYIDVAKQLEEKQLQFYVNVEIGNLTMGSAACTGTKDASFPGEKGQICSYLKSAKLLKADGSIIQIDETQPSLLQALRSSYGLFGPLLEVCFQIKPISAMAVSHKSFTLDQFEQALPAIQESHCSIMYYLFPHKNSITVEYRHYDGQRKPSGRKAWWVRNLAWKAMAPGVSALLSRCVKHSTTRYFFIDQYYRFLQFLLNTIISSNASFPADQIIRYPERKGLSKYTFSIWAFPENQIMSTMRAYYAFCQDYYEKNGYRCDMLNVGYRIEKDQNPLFSYSFNETVMTLDPVCTASESGWDDFLLAYNQFCHEHNGVPLFNQSKWLTHSNVNKAFGSRVTRFTKIRQEIDPNNRFLNRYFSDLLEPGDLSENTDTSDYPIETTEADIAV